MAKRKFSPGWSTARGASAHGGRATFANASVGSMLNSTLWTRRASAIVKVEIAIQSKDRQHGIIPLAGIWGWDEYGKCVLSRFSNVLFLESV